MATTGVEKTIMSAQVPVAMRERLERLAAEADRTLSAEVRRACAAYLDREDDDPEAS